MWYNIVYFVYISKADPMLHTTYNLAILNPIWRNNTQHFPTTSKTTEQETPLQKQSYHNAKYIFL